MTRCVWYSLMMKGRNNGKKLMTVRIVSHAFEIIHLLTDQNPIQVQSPPSSPPLN
jgi:ribosomal protein S7